jgi:sugar/nucleoside kinase (ribokinase family)
MRMEGSVTSQPLSFFGSLTIDDLVFPDGTTRWAVPGGNAAYAALGASLWSPEVRIVAPLGSDYPVELLQGRIDLSRCLPLPHSLRNWGLYEEDGRRHFVSRSCSRNWRQFCPGPEDALSAAQTAAHVAAMPRDVAIDLVAELRAQQASIISLDLDDHDLSGPGILEETIDLLRAVDLFLPSWRDVSGIVPAKEPRAALRQLRQLAPEPLLIAIKCGPNGVYAHLRGSNRWLHVPAVDVKVVDATGAGDAFCGGFLARFMRDRDPVESLIHGAVSASLCVERQGFEGLLSAAIENAAMRKEQLRRCISTGALETGGLKPAVTALGTA